jgi:hypothetical protein
MPFNNKANFMTALSLLSQHLPKECVSLLQGVKENAWLDILKKTDKKKGEQGARVSKLFKAICVKTPDWQNNNTLKELAVNLDSYLERHKGELTKKAKTRFKEVHQKFTEKNNKTSPPQVKGQDKGEVTKVVQTSPLVNAAKDMFLCIAEYVVECGNGQFLNKENNLALFLTCKDLNAHLFSFMEGKGKAVGDVLRKVLTNRKAQLLPSKAIFKPIGKGIKQLDLSGICFPYTVHRNLLSRITKYFLNLEELVLSQSNFFSYAPLKNLKNLKSISISHCNFLNSQLDPLFKIETLQYLRLMHCQNISDRTLEQIGSKLKNLVHLNLKESSGFTANGFKHLTQLPNLENLNVQWFWRDNHSPVSATSLPEICKITSLKKLNLNGNQQVTNAMIPTLAKLTKLQSLDLENCSVNDEGIGHILSLTNVTHLNLSGLQKFSNQGLESLTPLKKLRELLLKQRIFSTYDNLLGLNIRTQVPEDATIRYLKEKMPELTVKVS